jgi:hypothetical protein
VSSLLYLTTIPPQHQNQPSKAATLLKLVVREKL